MNEMKLQKKIRLLKAHIKALEDVWDGYDPGGDVQAAAEEVMALKENDVENR